MFRAKDFMKTAVICARPEMPIYDALRLLANRNITSMPVVDAELNLVGMLGENEALKTVYDNREDQSHCVSDFMSRNYTSFDAETNLVELCEHMMTSAAAGRLAPITRGRKLLGIVGRSDLVRAILRIKHQELPD